MGSYFYEISVPLNQSEGCASQAKVSKVLVSHVFEMSSIQFLRRVPSFTTSLSPISEVDIPHPFAV